MEKIYFYVFNIKTNEIKIEECSVEYGPYYSRLRCVRNGKHHKFLKKINDIESFIVERKNFNITAVSRDDSKIEEFKKKCIELVLECKESWESHIKEVEEKIVQCNKALEFLTK